MFSVSPDLMSLGCLQHAVQNRGYETVDDTIYIVKFEIGDKIGAEIGVC